MFYADFGIMSKWQCYTSIQCVIMFKIENFKDKRKYNVQTIQ